MLLLPHRPAPRPPLHASVACMVLLAPIRSRGRQIGDRLRDCATRERVESLRQTPKGGHSLSVLSTYKACAYCTCDRRSVYEDIKSQATTLYDAVKGAWAYGRSSAALRVCCCSREWVIE